MCVRGDITVMYFQHCLMTPKNFFCGEPIACGRETGGFRERVLDTPPLHGGDQCLSRRKPTAPPSSGGWGATEFSCFWTPNLHKYTNAGLGRIPLVPRHFPNEDFWRGVCEKKAPEGIQTRQYRAPEVIVRNSYNTQGPGSPGISSNFREKSAVRPLFRPPVLPL